MAKQKKRNFKIEPNELTPVTIGQFENRKKSSLGIFVVLSIFILTVIFLPQISDYVNSYLNKGGVTLPGVSGLNPKPINPPDDEEDYSDKFYPLDINLKIEREDITMSNFVISTLNNVISYRVTNNKTEEIVLTDLNYYLELYNKDYTLLERVKIKGDKIAPNGTENYSVDVTNEVAQALMNFVLVKKTERDYNPINLQNDTEGNGALVCTRSHEVVTYKFKDNLLKELTSEVKYESTDAGYVDKQTEYRNLANQYNIRSGVTSTYLDTPTSFSITTQVDLNNASRAYIFNADTFVIDTEPKVVNFEMESQGFTCN